MKMYLILITIIVLGFSVLYWGIYVLTQVQDATKYRITQHVDHEEQYNNLAPSPRIQTVVWCDREIVKSWYDHIESDSTALEAKQRAEQWLKTVEANEKSVK
jgi:hypothetical protein